MCTENTERHRQYYFIIYSKPLTTFKALKKKKKISDIYTFKAMNKHNKYIFALITLF